MKEKSFQDLVSARSCIKDTTALISCLTSSMDSVRLLEILNFNLKKKLSLCPRARFTIDLINLSWFRIVFAVTL